jgi:8-oxo-dGTP pyrophosphatase MutT (NUDIX family)
MEDTDTDLIDTAIREAFEETGILAKRSNVIGTLTPVQIPISGFSVLPVILFLKKSPSLFVVKSRLKAFLLPICSI